MRTGCPSSLRLKWSVMPQRHADALQGCRGTLEIIS
nr:MAG TPA: hypothetical protein [Bacteriophage sp.]